MFYTKYRPQKFSEISRPNEAADALSTQVATGKTVHAYLFVGPRGTGKTSTARILAKALNCPNLDKTGDPCDDCGSCTAIRNGSYLDLIEIDAASNRGIDDIRELKNRVKLAPSVGDNKIYIIDEVHMLTTEAFNALLKTLEEPPKKTTFILCTTELNKVPDTIKSRCQVFKFRRATIKQLVTKLERISEVEGISLAKEDLEKIARASLGGFRDAETLLQQIAEGQVSVESILNVGSREKYVEFLGLLVDKNPGAAIRTINKVFGEGLDLYVWVGEFIKHVRDILMIKSGVSADSLDLTSEVLVDVKKQAEESDVGWLVFILEKLVTAHAQIKNSFIPQLPIEVAVVEICSNDRFNDSAGDMRRPVGPKAPRTPEKDVKKISPTKSSTAEVAGDAKETTNEDLGQNTSDPGNTEEVDLSAALVDLSTVEQKWADVMQKVDVLNRSVLALLKAGRPIRIEGHFLILEVSYSFHKERLEAPKNRQIVEDALRDVFNSALKVKCTVSNEKPKKFNGTDREVGVLTDLNVVTIDKDKVLDILDGGLPLM